MLNRLRKKREFLLKKEEEYKNQEIERKKNKVLAHLDDTSKLSYNLRKEGKTLLDEIIYNQKLEDKEVPYPKILVTTSKDPSSKLQEFAKHVSLIFNGLYFTRGNTTKEELNDNLIKNYYTTLIMIYETKGLPSSIIVSCYPFGNTYKFNITGVNMNKTINLGEYCYLVTDNINDNLKEVFSKMLPLSRSSRRILMLYNVNDKIAFRHYLISKGKKTDLKLDTAFDLKLYEIRKGTFEQEGEIEWVYKPHIKSNKSNVYNKVADE